MKNTHTLASFESNTNWGISGTLPQFDPALGTLTGVRVLLTSNASTRFRAESREMQSTEPEVSSSIVTTTIVGGVSIQATVGLEHSQALGPHDGAIDYSGASGFNVTKTGSASESANAPSLSEFTGTGTVPVAIAASATADCQGLGDYRFIVNTKSQASVTVEYTFTPAV